MDIGQAIQPGKQNPLAGIFSGLSSLLGIGSKEGPQTTLTQENKERDPAIAAMSTAKPDISSTVSASNPEHSANSVAMAAAKPEVPATPIAKFGEPAQPDAQQSMMLKVLEGALKPFGYDMDKLFKLLLKLNPAKLQEALLEAAQSLMARQTNTDAQAPALA